jgi:hypothetical protein
MTNKEKIEVAEQSLIPWPKSQDDRVWNARVDYLINRLIKREKNEPKNGQGQSPDSQ